MRPKTTRRQRERLRYKGGILWCINECADFILECKRVARSGEKTSYQAHAQALEARYHLSSRDKAGIDFKCNCSKPLEMSPCGLDVFRIQWGIGWDSFNVGQEVSKEN